MSEAPQLPKGVVFLLKNVLGVEPGQMQEALDNVLQGVQKLDNFTKHFDNRMVALEMRLARIENILERDAADRNKTVAIKEIEHDRPIYTNGTGSSGSGATRDGNT